MLRKQAFTAEIPALPTPARNIQKQPAGNKYNDIRLSCTFYNKLLSETTNIQVLVI